MVWIAIWIGGLLFFLSLCAIGKKADSKMRRMKP